MSKKTKSLFFIIIFTLCFQLSASEKKTICLNMIVKNEKDVICRCLESVKPIIDYWVIVDTGSSDGTQQIIKDYMKDVPGELHERPWLNFAHNRNEALTLAQDKADYLLFIDADETIDYSDNFTLPDLNQDFYHVTMLSSGLKYANTKIVKANKNWKWEGVLHEYLNSDSAKTSKPFPGLAIVARPDGARSKDPEKYQKDAKVLEEALKDDPNNSRYVFYLAQSYRDAGDKQKSLFNYLKRISMGGWDQEVYYSQLQAALLKEQLNMEPDTIVAEYYEAYRSRPKRIEPLYHLANYYRRHDKHEQGYEAATLGLNIRTSDDILFVDQWVYDWGLLLEYSICAYWTERYNESLLASNLLLTNPDLPQNVRQCVKNNLTWIHSKINDIKKEKSQKISIVK